MFKQLNQGKAPYALGLDAMKQKARTSNKMTFLFSYAPVIAWYFCRQLTSSCIQRSITLPLFVLAKGCSAR
jgi:hypothetical protein